MPSPTAAPGKYLTIGVGPEAYGLPVLRVREIIRLQRITPVPQMPPFVKGVINLRGRVVPVADLRIKFGFPAEFADRTCIVVVQLAPAAGPGALMGLIVDRVEEVATLSAAEIEPTPQFGGGIGADYLLGLAKVRGQVKALLDLDKVVEAESAAAAAG